MRMQNLLKTVTTLSLAVLALAGCTPVQPRPECKAQPDKYVAKYFKGATTGMCDGKELTGEVLHLNYYRPTPSDPNQATSIGIEPDLVLAGLDAEPATPRPMPEGSIGRYNSAEPDDANLCIAKTLSDLNVTVGGTALGYKWSNLNMTVEPLSNAVHFGADLVRKDGDCTINYKVSAVFPVVSCGDDPKDPTMGKPSADLCISTQDNSLPPQIAYECDPVQLLCVPANMFPSLKK
jgi:hypothetical protein